MTTPEGKVKTLVKKALASKEVRGYLYGYWPVPSGYGVSSLDFIGCFRGYFFAIETKAKGKHPSARQQFIIDEMVTAGAKVFVIDDAEGVKELEDWLALGYANTC